MSLDPIKEGENYLKLFKIADNKYLIGVFQKGITFYKQQVRALNLFNELIRAKVLVPPSKTGVGKKRMRICVIGGGIGGMTFSAVALKTGFEIMLIEEKPVLLPMQHGCEVRKIHPNIYDWPESGKDSLSPNAVLPVLSWESGTASRVADKIRKEYEKIHSEANKLNPDRSIYHCDCKVYRVEDAPGTSKKPQIRVNYTKKADGQAYEDFDLLIYAPGYGIELGTEQSVEKLPITPSYWRNDDYSQPLVSKQTKTFAIYGTGDGALMDLFRLKIRDFDLDVLLNCLKNHSQNFEFLNVYFLHLKKEWEDLSKEDKDKKKNWLGQKLGEIKEEYYNHLIQGYILPNWVSNKKVIIVGKDHEFFEDNLDLRRISLLNAFLSFIIVRKLASRVNDEVVYFSGQAAKQKLKSIQVEHRIVRFGTDRTAYLKDLQIPESVINGLRDIQEDNALYDNGAQLWKYSEIVSLFELQKSNKRIEYYKHETVGICSSFISILARVLKGFLPTKEAKKNFRIALHRVIKVEDELCYQQITSYAENCTTIDTPDYSVLGSAYPIDRGNVGYAIRTGRSLLIKNPPKGKGEGFKKAMIELKMDSDFQVRKRRAFLSMPVLANTINDKISTNIVLYIDAETHDFFDRGGVIQVIYHALMGFVESIEKLNQESQIEMTKIGFIPLEIVNKSEFNNKQKDFIVDLSSKYSFLNPGNPGVLRLKEFSSFDIIYK